MNVTVLTTPSRDTSPVEIMIQQNLGDFIFPIVYPDYQVYIPEKYRLSVLNYELIGSKEKLGHAGVLIINGQDGVSKYYEFGRYDKEERGIVRNVKIQNAIIKDYKITESSLSNILDELSKTAGQNGRIESAVFIGDYYKKAYNWLTNDNNPYRRNDRDEYNILNFNCMKFVLDLLDHLEIPINWPGLFVKPDQEIAELQDDYIDLRYTPGIKKIEIEE